MRTFNVLFLTKVVLWEDTRTDRLLTCICFSISNMQMLLFSQHAPYLCQTFLALIKGEVTFWWDRDFNLALHQILLNTAYYHCYFLMALEKNPTCSSISIFLYTQKISVSKGFIRSQKNTSYILFANHFNFMFMCIQDSSDSMIRNS